MLSSSLNTGTLSQHAKLGRWPPRSGQQCGWLGAVRAAPAVAVGCRVDRVRRVPFGRVDSQGEEFVAIVIWGQQCGCERPAAPARPAQCCAVGRDATLPRGASDSGLLAPASAGQAGPPRTLGGSKPRDYFRRLRNDHAVRYAQLCRAHRGPGSAPNAR